MIEQLEKIIKIFEKTNVSKMELEIDKMILKLEKNENMGNSVNMVAATKVEDQDDVLEENIHYVTSPVVGTFYSAKNENSAPFATVGQKVLKGDVLCIVEAMKVMNEITATHDGIIKDILVSNEQMVQFEEKLFSIGQEDD